MRVRGRCEFIHALYAAPRRRRRRRARGPGEPSVDTEMVQGMVAFLGMLITALLAVPQLCTSQAAAVGATVSYSKLTWGACTGSDLQQFALDATSGLWTDKATGRCMSVLNKEQPVTGSNYAAVVLDTCGGKEYQGTPSGQKWTPQTPADIGKGVAIDVKSPLDTPPNWCINIPNSDCTTKNPAGALQGC